MTVKINMYVQEGDEMNITLEITHNQQQFFITKMVDVVDGKTKEQYVSDAYNAALPEIEAWKEDIETVGREFDPSTGTFA
jgi:hypothetical protein